MFLALDPSYINLMIYIMGFCVTFYVTFQILLASRLEEGFKKGKIWQIRVAYIFICIIVSHLVMSSIIYICSYFLKN